MRRASRHTMEAAHRTRRTGDVDAAAPSMPSAARGARLCLAQGPSPFSRGSRVTPPFSHPRAQMEKTEGRKNSFRHWRAFPFELADDRRQTPFCWPAGTRTGRDGDGRRPVACARDALPSRDTVARRALVPRVGGCGHQGRATHRGVRGAHGRPRSACATHAATHGLTSSFAGAPSLLSLAVVSKAQERDPRRNARARRLGNASHAARGPHERGGSRRRASCCRRRWHRQGPGARIDRS